MAMGVFSNGRLVTMLRDSKYVESWEMCMDILSEVI